MQKRKGFCEISHRIFYILRHMYGRTAGSCSLCCITCAKHICSTSALDASPLLHADFPRLHGSAPLIYSTELPVFGHLMYHSHIAIPLHTWLHASANYEAALFHPTILPLSFCGISVVNLTHCLDL